MAVKQAGGRVTCLYVHVPFCPHKCFYCDFRAYVYRTGPVAGFLEALAAEARLARPLSAGGGAVETFHAGGGTPTALDMDELTQLFRTLSAYFPIGEDAEVTVEANPETLTADKLNALRHMGVNRLSLGLQAWDDRLLALLGRRHSAKDFLASFGEARRAGFDNLAVDLIYGLPGQTVAGWRETLLRVIDLGPEHVSAYSLQIEEGTAFHRWLNEGRLRVAESSGRAGYRSPSDAGKNPSRGILPTEEQVLEMYHMARGELVAAGFKHYEISNFARHGFRSRHNQNYWKNGEYLGLGPAAASHLDGRRWTNLWRLDEYAAAVTAGRLPVGESEDVDREREMRDTLMLGFRLLEGVSLSWFQRRFGADLTDVFGGEVGRLEEEGLLERVGERLRLTERAVPVANRVFREFV